jgi:hypothetical protein
MSISARPDSPSRGNQFGSDEFDREDVPPGANNEVDDEPVIAHQEGDGLKQRLDSGNYKVVTRARSSTGKVSSQKVWKVKSLDKELTDALTAGKGVIRVHF